MRNEPKSGCFGCKVVKSGCENLCNRQNFAFLQTCASLEYDNSPNSPTRLSYTPSTPEMISHMLPQLPTQNTNNFEIYRISLKLRNHQYENLNFPNVPMSIPIRIFLKLESFKFLGFVGSLQSKFEFVGVLCGESREY